MIYLSNVIEGYFFFKVNRCRIMECSEIGNREVILFEESYLVIVLRVVCFFLNLFVFGKRKKFVALKCVEGERILVF